MTRRGFTLVEVLVALVVTALLAVTAHRVFAAGADAARSIAQARRSLDRASNGHRLLTTAFLSLEVGAAAQPFEGYADHARFGTWLETSDGWFEPVVVDLRCDRSRLVAQIGARPPLTLVDSVAAVRFDYLLEPGADEAWIAEWVSPLSAPIGVRMRVYRAAGGRVVGDTALFQIKARG